MYFHDNTLEMSSAKWRPYFPGLNVFTEAYFHDHSPCRQNAITKITNNYIYTYKNCMMQQQKQTR